MLKAGIPLAAISAGPAIVKVEDSIKSGKLNEISSLFILLTYMLLEESAVIIVPESFLTVFFETTKAQTEELLTD